MIITSHSLLLIVLFLSLFSNLFSKDGLVINSTQTQTNYFSELNSLKSEIFVNPDSCISELSSIISYSQQSQNDSLYFSAKQLLATTYYYKNNIDSMYFLSMKTLEEIPENKYPLTRMHIYNLLALYYGNNYYFDKSLKYLSESKQIASSMLDSTFLIGINNNIANVYLLNEDYQSAIDYYKRSLELSNSFDEENNSWSVCKNLILSYIKINRLDSANIYLDFLFKTYDERMYNFHRLYHYKSIIFNKSKQYDSALHYIRLSLSMIPNNRLIQKIETKASLFENLLFFYKSSKYLDSLKQYVSITRQYSHPNLELEILKAIKSYYDEVGDYKNAYAYYQQYISLADSLKKLSNEKMISTLKLDLNYSKLTNDLNQQSLQLEVSNQRIYTLTAVIFLILIILTTVFIYSRSRNKLIRVLKIKNLSIERSKQALEEQNNQIMNQKLQIESIVKDLSENKNKLEALNKQKDTFMSVFTHQITNQVQAVLVSAETLNQIKNDSGELGCKCSEILVSSANHLKHMLVNLMEWSRTQSGNMTANPECFYLKEIFKRNISKFDNLMNNKKLNLIVGDCKHSVFADKAMIDTVFKNVISNAIKYSHEGGSIEFSCEMEENYIISTIKDYGIGIPADLIDKLFNIETRVASRGTFGEQGSGLGLSICKELLSLNNGKIEIDTEEGKGTLIKIHLPTIDIE